MNDGHHQALLGAFVDEFARCGMRDACTSPGSRCAPLVLALAGEQRLRCHSHIDERCAGFFALGLAKAARLPVAVTCTSGTAVAELLPAVVEAHEARVPLIVLSADRPPELRDVGAGQTIDQLGIFGRFAKWFFEVGTHEPSDERVRWMRMLACRAHWTALDGRPGVVHLNFALREPLVSEQQPGPAAGPAAGGGRTDGRPLLSRFPSRHVRPEDEDSLAQALHGRRRGVVVAGRHERDTPLGEAAARFCASAGWPLLADPMSGARRGDAAVAHYDALLRSKAFAERMRPDIVLRVGDLPVSKPLRSWLASMPDVPQAAIDAEGAWHDPDACLCRTFALEPAAALSAVSAPPADPDWLAAWGSADERAAEAIRAALVGTAGRDGDRGLSGAGSLSEPLVAAELGVLLPEQATLFTASSMPVRDIETFWPVRPDPPRVLCNRGANGIDGTVSSAFGAAAASEGPVVLLIGDVAFAHDIGGLLAAERLGLKLTIVLLNNGGGGIFDFLPVAHAPAARARPGNDRADGSGGKQGGDGALMDGDVYTRHIATPTGLDFVKAAALYGLAHIPVADVEAFRAALEQAISAPRSTLIEVAGERTANVDLHKQLSAAVSAAVTDA